MTDYKALRALCDAATDGEYALVKLGKFHPNCFSPVTFIKKTHPDMIRVDCVGEKNQYSFSLPVLEAATDPQTVRALIDEVEELRKFADKFIDECESEMSRAEHRKKIADMDYHQSEENHQDGRWHCANDLRKFAQQALKGTGHE